MTSNADASEIEEISKGLAILGQGPGYHPVKLASLPMLRQLPQEGWSDADRVAAFEQLIRGSIGRICPANHAEVARAVLNLDAESDLPFEIDRLVAFRHTWEAQESKRRPTTVDMTNRHAVWDSTRKWWEAARPKLAHLMWAEIYRQNVKRDWPKPSPEQVARVQDALLNHSRQPTPQPPSSPDLLTNMISLSPDLRDALDHYLDSCATQGRAFHTPDLLLALLDVRHSQVQYCLDKLRPGLAQELRAGLHRQLTNMRPGEVKPFEPFRWERHPLVRQAWKLAPGDKVDELHLFLVVLDGTSNTNKWLLSSLFGPNGKARLRDIANRMLRDGPDITPTPGYPPYADEID